MYQVEVEDDHGQIVWKRGEVREVKPEGSFVVCVAFDEEFLEEFTLQVRITSRKPLRTLRAT